MDLAQRKLRVCFDEWKRTSLNDHKAAAIDVRDALFEQKNAVVAYKALMEKL